MPESEKILREIEKKVDQEHKRLSIMYQPCDIGLSNFARAVEDAFFYLVLNTSKVKDPHSLLQKTNDLLGMTNHAVRWILNSAKPSVGDYSLNWEIYKKAGELTSMAMAYDKIAAGFVIWSQGLSSVSLNEQERIVDFESSNLNLNHIRHFYFNLGKEWNYPISDVDNNKLKKLEKECFSLLDSRLQKLNEDTFKIDIDQDLMTIYKEKIALEYPVLIPQELQDVSIYKSIQVKDLFEIIKILSSIAWIRFDGRKVFNGTGGGVGSCLHVSSRESLIELIGLGFSNISSDNVGQLLDILTFNPKEFRSDCRIQPIIDIGCGNLLIIPQTLIHNDFERNTISNLLRLNQNEYCK
mgnify:CR=1 FL=1